MICGVCSRGLARCYLTFSIVLLPMLMINGGG